MALQLPETDGFMPHAMGYLWGEDLLWMHVAADLVIGLSYVAISVALGWLVWRGARGRGDDAGPFDRLPFWWMFLAFGLFIVAGGVTHLLNVWTVWSPDHWAAGGAKVVTAVASLATAVALPPLIPRILRVVRVARISEARKKRLAEAHRELKRAHARIRELDELKSRFFANVSHELRTPLTLIAGPVQRRLDRPDLGEDERRALESVLRNARTLRKHVDDLLEIARLEAGSLEARYDRGDLAALVRRVAAHFDGLAEAQRIDFAVDAEGSVPATADLEKVERVLLNLLSNAFKFTPEGGTVRVALETDGSGEVGPGVARFTVSDSGPGVPLELRDAIFERFRRVEGGRLRPFGGTGLGLTIARELVELHGGRIRVDEAPGGGAEFTVELPREPRGVGEGEAPATGREEGSAREGAGEHVEVVVADLTSAEPPPADDAGTGRPPTAREGGERGAAAARSGEEPMREENGGDGTPTVLLVEDNRDMGRFLLQLLPAGVRGVWARDGREALELATEVVPDVVLSDLVMEGMGGEELLRALREHPALEHVPFLALTARADDASRLSILRQGAQDFIAKPFVPAEVELRVSNWITVSRARRLLRRELQGQEDDLEVLAGEVARHKREAERALEAASVAREEEALASRAKSDFLAVVSHELRTPLTAIVGYVDLMLEEIPGPVNDEQRTQLERIRASADQLLSLIEQILDFSSLERDRTQLRLEPVEVDALVSDVADQIRPRARSGGLDLRLEVRDEGVVLRTDPGRLRQVLLNVLTNAVKYTEEGHVGLSFRTEEGEAVFEIEDTGLGIAPEHRTRIFEPFWQVDQSATRVAGGTGLGLSIARRLARRLGGDVTVRAREGGGSVFEVRVPLDGPGG